ncbi:TPA: hypothetical protein DDZ10_00220 [Candidatus Uhrbacteria bacterium]|uniref:30S ribosomal protein S21 n=1 Tax=Candidatus Uhrbacteria bacterium GW2011_GWC2_53_7 TaxID=1618986 RepID=A0A0G1XXQ8_9BACT|nr:MAG: hypothetical protein UY79_C0003G0035 [Parcubacteria group bacterium GW2011_GWA2_53_21]KKW35675.1 MAG: hypothetical protein UY82_C0034G0004 [Candidatus Uhrbacteria bacterium GW2011_GWC2_53_7]OGL71417.1 MAG: hypothetical protein A3D69_03390 [Candidatus Uhrbacteria bacterium RIFCSPHIGHO2_02_FULL_54_11]HBL39089.1 hypothetical protein [Candidatus Uhrbacteria bacterium]
MLKITRRKNESFEAFFRRFNRRIQLSGRILQAKKVRYRGHDLNATKRKASAIRRIEKATEREYKLKTGQLKEEDFHQAPRRQ